MLETHQLTEEMINKHGKIPIYAYIIADVHGNQLKLPPVKIRICVAKKEHRVNARNVSVKIGKQPGRVQQLFFF